MAIIEQLAEPAEKDLDGENEPLKDFALTNSDRLHLLSQHAPLRPSALPTDLKNGKSPLLVVSPEELDRIVKTDKPQWADDQDGVYAEEEDIPLWEEILNDILWTIPFGFLYTMMDYAVHAQFGQDLKPEKELRRLASIIPSVFLLTFVTMRPNPLFPPFLLQSLLFAVCLAAGISLVHVTTREAYVNVIKQAPALGVIWVWSVVRLDLSWAVLGLVGVAAGAWYRGELAGAKWW